MDELIARPSLVKRLMLLISRLNEKLTELNHLGSNALIYIHYN